MTLEEINKFRSDFASIVYWKGVVKSDASYIGRLESWNKGGSHDRAIVDAIKQLNEHRAKLKDKLKGKSYDEWKDFSKQLSIFKNKLNQAVNESTKEKWRNKIESINFN